MNSQSLPEFIKIGDCTVYVDRGGFFPSDALDRRGLPPETPQATTVPEAIEQYIEAATALRAAIKSCPDVISYVVCPNLWAALTKQLAVG